MRRACGLAREPDIAARTSSSALLITPFGYMDPDQRRPTRRLASPARGVADKRRYPLSLPLLVRAVGLGRTLLPRRSLCFLRRLRAGPGARSRWLVNRGRSGTRWRRHGISDRPLNHLLVVIGQMTTTGGHQR